MMNKHIDKFEYKKILDAQSKITSAKSTLIALNRSLKYGWVQDQIDGLELVDQMLDGELRAFLSERYMLAYYNDSADYHREPELMTGRSDYYPAGLN
jgi:hypothetical protein